MIHTIPKYFDKSIKRLVMASFVFVLLLPIGFFAYSLFENSWHRAQQPMLEKHQLIATSMVEPFSLYISSRQQSIQALDKDILELESETKEYLQKNKQSKIQEILDKYLNSYKDLIAVSYSTGPGLNTHQISTRIKSPEKLEQPNYIGIPLSMLSPLDDNKSSFDLLSPTFKSSISKQPVILMKHYILNKQDKIVGALHAEISPQYIGRMCSKINFGVKGHCAVVDQAGRVIAHPNKAWVKEIRDLSKISIVQKMLDGETGTTEFYSPFLKADMVAGFSSIPGLGWGIMIPQPKSELTKALNDIRSSTLVWLSLGILVALFVAYMLTRRITTPISILTKRTGDVSNSYEHINFGSSPKNSPEEIRQLWSSFSTLLSGLQKSNKEVKRLNVSLNEDIHKATVKLRALNKRLYDNSNQDYLTSLANRRFFTNALEKVITQETNEKIGIILIDIDNFKSINDKHGHLAGDLALNHLSKILKKYVRKVDLVARLGGDEFVVYIKNSPNDTLKMLAEHFRQTVENKPVVMNDKSIYFTLSIGTVNVSSKEKYTLEEILGFADKAMYKSKQTGRNHVSAYTFETKKPSTDKAF